MELTPTQRLLGVGADDGPFELLGLEREPASEETIRAAAKSRYDRFAAGNFDPHDVIAAQEAVAAAEALLCDVDVQREWLRMHHRPAEPEPKVVVLSRPSAVSYAPAVQAALAQAGGWNSRAAVQVGAIAQEAGIAPADLIRAATQRPRRVAVRAAPVVTSQPVRPAASHVEPDREDAAEHTISLTVVFAAVALTATALVLTAALVFRSRPAPAQDTPAALAEHLPIELPFDPILDPLPETDATTPAVLLEAMSAALHELETDPSDAAWRMEEAIFAFAGRWDAADVGERAKAITHLRDFLTRVAAGGGAAQRVAMAIALPLGEHPPSPPTAASARALVWSAGVVAELAAESGIPAATRDALLGAVSSLPSSRTFEQGGRAALREIAAAAARSSVAAEPALWDAWAGILDELTPGRALARQRQAIALDTLEALLLGVATPSRRQSSFHAAEVLLPRIDFDGSRAALARERFLAWLDDPRVASIDLAIVMRTARLPEFASAELAPSASVEARSLLRERLLREWGMQQEPAPSQRLAKEWHRAKNTVASMPRQSSMDHLTRAVARARLLEGASAAWGNEPLRARDELLEVGRVVSSAPRGTGAPGAPASSDGRWTIEHFSVRRSGEGALLALDRAAVLGELGPVDARTLAHLAILGSPPQVRRRAQELVSDRADEPRVLEAVLELLPRAPRTPRVAELIDTLASDRTGDAQSDGWPLRARRALAGRLSRRLEPDDSPARVQRLSVLLRDALAPSSRFAGAPPVDAAAAAAEIADALLKEATALGVAPSLDAAEARRRRDGRRRVATGPIQRAVIETTAIAEALAALASAERPGSAAAAALVLDDMLLMQRRASDSFEQLDSALGSAVELWELRLGYRGSPGSLLFPAPGPGAMHAVMAMGAGLPLASARLDALDPADPEGYLRLAEEIAYDAANPGEVALARRLALLAAQLARGDQRHAATAASACLLLTDLSTSGEERRWLRALADGFGARDGLLRWRTDAARNFDARFMAAEVLGLVRAEENRRAGDRFRDPAVRGALEEYSHAIPGGISTLRHRIEHAPSCPECKNERVIRSPQRNNEWVLCYTCRGQPSPRVGYTDLVQYLRVERALLGEELDWGVEVATRGAPPLRDLTLEEAAASYGVNLLRTVYRNGLWVEPAVP